MNDALKTISRPLLLTAAAATFAGCASMNPPSDPAVMRMRASLSELQANRNLALRAPSQIAAADAAIAAAEAEQDHPGSDELSHRSYIADRKLATAWATAQDSAAKEQLALLASQQSQAQLAANQRNAELARWRSEQQQRLALANAQQQAYAARQQAEIAMMETQEYRRQVADLQTRPSERGLVVTLGDVLFAPGSAQLMPGAAQRLDSLVAFLRRYPQHTAVIEGHTDSFGSEAYNMALSSRRAQEVRGYILRQGIAVERVSAVGRGKGDPVASNQDAAGRQQNRRVEVILQASNS